VAALNRRGSPNDAASLAMSATPSLDFDCDVD